MKSIDTTIYYYVLIFILVLLGVRKDFKKQELPIISFLGPFLIALLALVLSKNYFVAILLILLTLGADMILTQIVFILGAVVFAFYPGWEFSELNFFLVFSFISIYGVYKIGGMAGPDTIIFASIMSIAYIDQNMLIYFGLFWLSAIVMSIIFGSKEYGLIGYLKITLELFAMFFSFISSVLFWRNKANPILDRYHQFHDYLVLRKEYKTFFSFIFILSLAIYIWILL